MTRCAPDRAPGLLKPPAPARRDRQRRRACMRRRLGYAAAAIGRARPEAGCASATAFQL